MAEAATALVVAEEQPRAPRPPLVAGNSPRAIVPTDFDGAWRIATAVVRAQMAPRSLETVEKCTIAILHGLEVGLPPMMALQSIAVINGRPSIWGDGALALIQSSGLLDDMDEFYEGQEGADGYKAVCVLKRKGRSKVVRGEFSMADAKKAGLLSKDGPWKAYTKRMLKMRARAFALRDGFADVLKGLSLAEEQEDVVRARQPSPQSSEESDPPPPANDESGPPAPSEETTGTAQVVNDDPPAPDDEMIGGVEQAPHVPSERQWLANLSGRFEAATDMSELADAQIEHMTPYQNSVSEQTWQAASDLLDHHIERVQQE